MAGNQVTIRRTSGRNTNRFSWPIHGARTRFNLLRMKFGSTRLAALIGIGMVVVLIVALVVHFRTSVAPGSLGVAGFPSAPVVLDEAVSNSKSTVADEPVESIFEDADRLEDLDTIVLDATQPNRGPPNADLPVPLDLAPLGFDNCNELLFGPWRTSWGARHVGVLVEDRQQKLDRKRAKIRQLTTSWQLLDRSTGQPSGDPLMLGVWDIEDRNPLADQIPFGMSPDGQRFVISEPPSRNRVDLFTADGKKRFGFYPFGEEGYVFWADFDGVGRLLVEANHEITAWEIGNDEARQIYQTSGGGYVAPHFLLPGRKQLVASRGSSFDIIDVSTGRCLKRMGIRAEGTIADIGISPDGKRAAAVYTNGRTRIDLLQHSKPSTLGATTIAVWDLETGKAQKTAVKPSEFTGIAWLGPDHLCVLRPAAEVFDLRLNLNPFSLTGTNWLGKTPDGQLFCFDLQARRWKRTTVTGQRTAQEGPYFADDRKTVDVRKMPLRLELDVANAARGKSHGERIIGELQGRGYTIGRSGFVLKITPRVVISNGALQNGKKRVAVPQVNYDWRLLDSQQTLAWSATSSGQFLGVHSQYYTGTNGITENFDFGSQSAEQAIVAEILADGNGLKVPDTLPTHLILGNGTFSEFPVMLNWTFVAGTSSSSG